MFSIEHAGVTPDIILMGKGIASGMPLAVMGAPQVVMDQAPYGSQGGTFNGNAVACAAAVATLDVIADENLLEKAATQGAYLLERLQDVASHFASGQIDVRGRGLMVAVEMLRADGSAAKTEVEALLARCRAHGLLMLGAGAESNAVRMTPPLVVTREQIDEAVNIFAAALDAIMA